jgi:hypothetical protein
MRCLVARRGARAGQLVLALFGLKRCLFQIYCIQYCCLRVMLVLGVGVGVLMSRRVFSRVPVSADHPK